MDQVDTLTNRLKKDGFTGDFDDSPTTLDLFSHDASMFELRPTLVVAPKNTADVEKLVKEVAASKKK